MDYSSGPIPRCGCEYGDDCTKTTVCAANAHAEELLEEIERLQDKIKTMRETIRETGRRNFRA